MAVGLGVLRLSPRDFWGMSLPELTAAMRGLFGHTTPTPPSRSELAALMAAYPDGSRSAPSCARGDIDLA